MIFVQNREFFFPKKVLKISAFQASVSPLSYLVNAYIRFYVIVIYINHFKNQYITASVCAYESLTVIGIMTIYETNDIRMNCPYLL